MFNWTADDSEDTPAALDLARDLGRGKLNHRGDVMGVADALDQAGVYDKRRFGNPPLADEHLFTAIERFQDDQGLEVDGLMKPGGPTVTRLNAVLGRHAHVADADAAPDAAPAPAPDDGDGDGPRFVDLFRARRDAGAPEGFGPAFETFEPDAPALQLAQARVQGPQPSGGRRREPVLAERIAKAIGDTSGYREPPSRARAPIARDSEGLPLPPWNVIEKGNPPSPMSVPRRSAYWQALRDAQADPSPGRRIGPRLAEALQVFVEGEGGAAQARDSTAYAGVINGTLNGARTRLRRSDPAFAARLPDTAGELSPTQWTQVLRDHLNEDLRRAGGVQAIEDIGNAAPERGSREVCAVIVTMMLRDNGASMTRRIQQSVNATLGRLRRNDAVRDSGTLPADLPVTGVFGEGTRDTITALLRAGHGDELRISLLDAYDRYNRTRPVRNEAERLNDTARIRWFQGLRLPS